MFRFILLIFFFISGLAQAFPYTLTYSGRLTNPNGSPVTGDVTLEAKFFDAIDAETALVTKPAETVTLQQGVFSLDITLTNSEANTIFSHDDVWIQVHQDYPRQKFSVVPYALRVPVDETTITYDTSGRLKLTNTFGYVPIGTILPWHRDAVNGQGGADIPLPDGWAECNGSPVSVETNGPLDPDGDGQYTVPNLNSNTQDGTTNSGMFLRGAGTSGVMQADATAINALDIPQRGYECTHNGGWQGLPANCRSKAAHAAAQVDVVGAETRPANMSVVWIIRVK